MTENFARATSNGENLHAFGGGVLSTSTNWQAKQSSSVSGQPEDFAVFENLRTPEYQRPLGQSKSTRQGQLVEAEDVQREGLVNNCGRLHLGSIFLFRGAAGCAGEPAYRWCGRVVKGLLCVCTVVQLLRGTF